MVWLKLDKLDRRLRPWVMIVTINWHSKVKRCGYKLKGTVGTQHFCKVENVWHLKGTLVTHPGLRQQTATLACKVSSNNQFWMGQWLQFNWKSYVSTMTKSLEPFLPLKWHQSTLIVTMTWRLVLFLICCWQCIGAAQWSVQTLSKYTVSMVTGSTTCVAVTWMHCMATLESLIHGCRSDYVLNHTLAICI